MDIPCGEILELLAITNPDVIFVTHASIINIDFSKKFYNFSSAKYNTLYYQGLLPPLRLII